MSWWQTSYAISCPSPTDNPLGRGRRQIRPAAPRPSDGALIVRWRCPYAERAPRLPSRNRRATAAWSATPVARAASLTTIRFE